MSETSDTSGTVTHQWVWDKHKTGVLYEEVQDKPYLSSPGVITKLLRVQAGPRKKGQHSQFAWTVELLPASTKQRFNIVTAEGGTGAHKEVEEGALKMVRYMASEWAKLADRLPPEVAAPRPLHGVPASSWADEPTTRGDTMVEEMRGLK